MMKKLSKIGIVVLVMAMVCSLAVGCSGKKDDASGDKVYKISTDNSFYPFCYIAEDGKSEGFDVDLLAAIAEDQGFKYELSAPGFDPSMNAVTAGQADGMIAGMSVKPEREETFDFSDTYYECGLVFAVKADSTVAKVDDLKGQKIATKNGTTGKDYVESIQAQYGFEVINFESSDEMIQAVLSGQAVAYCEDRPVILGQINKGSALKTVGEDAEAAPYAFAVKKGENAELLKLFNEGLKNVKANGKYDELLAKYKLN